jgi:hypothetical protein
MPMLESLYLLMVLVWQEIRSGALPGFDLHQILDTGSKSHVVA